MTIPRFRLTEGSLAGATYTLVVFGLTACALLLFLLLSQADAKRVTDAHGANSFTDLVAFSAIAEPASLALLGTGLLSGAFGAPAQTPPADSSNPCAASNRAGGEHGLAGCGKSRSAVCADLSVGLGASVTH